METLNISVIAKGPECPHCGSVNRAYFIKPQNGKRLTKAGNVSYAACGVITRTCGSTTRPEARRTFLVDQNEIRWR
ncbi:MAG TPA: hypothetical protein VGV93_02195 [Acidimicrobiales bacterium]|nr:hypothetical protein [Acidimicrobiales bacterium]